MNYCTCCGRQLDPSKSVWLELDQRIMEYHDFGGIPDDRNQGGFEFGPGCARTARAKAREALDHIDAQPNPS
jgi:hypothetical protein